MTSIVLGDRLTISRDAVMAGLRERGIDSRPFFPALSSFSMFTSREAANPTAYRLAARGINLPSGHNLTEDDVDRVCTSLLEVIGETSQLKLVAA